MNILNFLSFDIGEFLTSTEGILIIAGIICLIIGIVCLCMGNGKGKKDSTVVENQANNDAVPTNDQVAPVNTENVSSVSTVESNTNVDSVPSSVVSDKVVEPVVISSTPQNNSSVTSEASPVAPSAPAVEKLDVTQSIPSVAPEVLTSSSNVEQSVESLNNSNPVPEVLSTPTVVNQNQGLEVESPSTSPVSTTATVLPEPTPVTPSVPTQSSAYGGASLDVPNGEALFEKPREIYGGANPLENTAPIPTEKVTTAYHSSVTPVETLNMSTSNSVGNGTVSQYQNNTPVVTPVTPAVNSQPTPSVAPSVSTVNVPPVAPVTSMNSNTPVVTPVANPTPSVTPSVPVTPAMPSAATSVTPMAPKEEIEKLEF